MATKVSRQEFYDLFGDRKSVATDESSYSCDGYPTAIGVGDCFVLFKKETTHNDVNSYATFHANANLRHINDDFDVETTHRTFAEFAADQEDGIDTSFILVSGCHTPNKVTEYILTRLHEKIAVSCQLPMYAHVNATNTSEILYCEAMIGE